MTCNCPSPNGNVWCLRFPLYQCERGHNIRDDAMKCTTDDGMMKGENMYLEHCFGQHNDIPKHFYMHRINHIE